MRHFSIFSAITTLGLLTFSNAHSVELMDVELTPPGYAWVEISENPGKEKTVFGTKSILWRPASMDKILKGYGLELDIDKVDDLPSGYAGVREVETKDGMKKEVFFYDSITIRRPASLDRIFNAYGVTLDLDKFEDLPRGYATTKKVKNEDGEEETKVVFSKHATMWHPASINKILSAYH